MGIGVLAYLTSETNLSKTWGYWIESSERVFLFKVMLAFLSLEANLLQVVPFSLKAAPRRTNHTALMSRFLLRLSR